MNVLSLFDGISCGRVALEKAGFKVDNYYASEIDKYAQQVSEKNYPDIIRMGDVTKWKEWNIDWSSIDLILGGSPCQGFSLAGNQLAFDDPRSALFFEFLNICNHAKIHNQNVKFLLENVMMKQEYQDVITRLMGVQPMMINSSLLSAQNRKRLYWFNWDAPQPEDKGLFMDDVLEKEVDSKYNLTESNIKTITRDFGSKGKVLNQDSNFSLIEKMTYPSRINQNFGSIKCPTLTAAMGTGGGNVPVVIINDIIRKLTPIECERLQTLPDDYTKAISNSQRYKSLGNGWTVDVIAHILKGMEK